MNRRIMIEPYDLNPCRREKRAQRIEWFVAAGLVSGLMWWLGWNIYVAWNAGVPGFVDVYNTIIRMVSGS